MILPALWLALLAAVPAAPQDARALLTAGMRAEKAGSTQSAIRRFQDVLRSNPTADVAAQARLELVRIHQRRGEWWEAAQQLQQLRSMAPQDAELAYQLGVAYRSISKAAFERLRAVAPQSARAQQMLGEQYSIGGETEKAIAAFRQAAAADPKLAGSHLALAVLFARQGQREQALAEIELELQIAPQSAAARSVKQALGGEAR